MAYLPLRLVSMCSLRSLVKRSSIVMIIWKQLFSNRSDRCDNTLISTDRTDRGDNMENWLRDRSDKIAAKKTIRDCVSSRVVYYSTIGGDRMETVSRKQRSQRSDSPVMRYSISCDISISISALKCAQHSDSEPNKTDAATQLFTWGTVILNSWLLHICLSTLVKDDKVDKFSLDTSVRCIKCHPSTYFDATYY